MARKWGTKLRIVAAEACGAVFGQTGTDRVEWYACPRLTLFATEWSAARRKPIRAAVVPIRSPFLKTSKPVGFRRAAAENFRPEIFEARATLREQRESAVGRRSAQPKTSPFARRPHRTRLRHRAPSAPSPFARNRGMSPFRSPQTLAVLANTVIVLTVSRRPIPVSQVAAS